MDPRHFDTLIRSLSNAGSRRHALLVATRGAVALLGLSQADAVVAGGACQPAGGACQSCQPGKCHKPKHGKKHCQRGTCMASPSGTVACGGACVDLASDPRNCGSCGTRCSVNQTCNAGTCRCALFDGRLCQVPTPNATCCAGGGGCACSPVSPTDIFDPTICNFSQSCPPERQCVGPQCAACCPVGTTCEPSTGRCLQ